MRKKRQFLSYFGEGEKRSQTALTSRRDNLLRGLTKWCVRHNIRANHITFLSFLLQAAFFPLFFGFGWWVAALTVLSVHILLDGIDGSVARAGQAASQSGALADILNDITGMAIVGLAVIFLGRETHPGVVALYVVLYLYHTIFILILGIFGRQFFLIIRTKYFFFGFVFLKYWLNIDWLEPFLLISSVYMFGHSVVAMLRVFRVLDEQERPPKSGTGEDRRTVEPQRRAL